MFRQALSLCISLLLALHVTAADRKQYNAVIRTPKAAITGICLVVTDSVSTRGVLMNEFGIKTLAFERGGKKLRLTYVLPMLDKWYIRLTLRRDLRRLLDGQPQNDGTLHYDNERRHITYTLTPIDETH